MSIRMLIADDDPLMRVLVTVSLADIAETIEAADGDEVLRLLNERDFDLVLLDWNMPGPDGLQVLRAVRGGAPGYRSSWSRRKRIAGKFSKHSTPARLIT